MTRESYQRQQALQRAEEQRAEEDRVDALQDQLRFETGLRRRRGGLSGLFGASSLTSFLGSG